jgi:tetratricopeptide (TPR) repeat protein
LIDGTDLGIGRQLTLYAGESCAPGLHAAAASPVRVTRCASAEMAKDCESERSFGALLSEAGLPAELVQTLARSGVANLADLIRVASQGDLNEALRGCGVTKLGQRQKLAAIVQPYWSALVAKERGNAMYKSSRYEDAVAEYSAAIAAMQCRASTLALRCYSNRAAAYQQMREHKLALGDIMHVLSVEPQNEKACARLKVLQDAVRADE